jgi:orotidine-5'-phosphate decarboxylase
MNFYDQLRLAARQNTSMLCVGLDPEPARFPARYKGDTHRIYDFCAAVVDATADLVLAFKPQIAYFAAHRAEAQLEALIEHMRRTAPQVPVILDAKRGDIGSTAEQYAVEAFERYGADAVTLSPFMGFDSVQPYLKHAGKGVFLLCRTSNPGGDDFQARRLADVPGQPHPGECLGVIGPNGAGKTTTIRMCLGLTAPDWPHSRPGRQMPEDALAIKAQLGVVSQMDTLDPDFSCEENLLVYGRYFGLKDAQIRERIPGLLEFASLTHKAKAKPGELSGGMKRRLSLWRVHWSTIRACCCWTNPPPGSTRRRAT